MSYLAFVDQNAAAATLSNMVVYKQQVVIPTSGPASTDFPIFTTESSMGRFVPLEVWFHIDANSGVNTLTFTSSVGFDANRTNICSSTSRGGTTLANQLQQYRALKFATTFASNYSNCVASGSTTVYLRVTAYPSSTLTGTVFILGYYTGMRP